MKKNICVIGAGKWGLNHVKTLKELNSLGGVIDKNPSTLNYISKKYPECHLYSSLDDDIIKKFDGFIIATDPLSHFELAKRVILGKKPVLVEKPLTLDYESSKTLCTLAKKMAVNLMVGHVLLFHPAFQKMKNLIEDGKIGEIQYIYSNRLNMGTFRTNENVFWSFAPHDIALFNYFFNKKPSKVNSNGIDILQTGIHDTTVTTFEYFGKKMGHIFVSWLHPFKEHRFVVVGSKGMLHFEDSKIGKPLLFYDNRVKMLDAVPTSIGGEISQIKYRNESPLNNELKYFISCIDNGLVEISDGYDGLKVIDILEQASKSLYE